MSARQRRVALSRMASKMGCKSCGELAMARRHFRDGRLLLDEFGQPILQLRNGPFSVATRVHAEQFLGLDGEGSITAPAAVRDSSHGRPNRRCGQTSVCSGSDDDRTRSAFPPNSRHLRWRTRCPFEATIADINARRAPPAIARGHRSSRTVNSAQSPSSLSTVMVPPCCCVTIT